jgi:hypothetical protein
MNRKLDGRLLPALVTAVTIACGQSDGGEKLTELQRARSGMLDVVLLSSRDGLRHGHDSFVIEFRSTADRTLVDVGTVKATTTMPMAGMPMLGSIDVKRTNVAGRYEASADFSMAGTWRTTVEWNGQAGQGSVTLAGAVQ